MPKQMIAMLALIFFMPAVSSAGSQEEPEMRTWTSADGKFTVRAALLDYQDRAVQLRREDGKEVTVPLSALSTKDRMYLAGELKRRKEAAQPPTSGPSGTARADGPWPRWRGVNIDGKCGETGLMKEWPADGPPLAWQVDGLGSGYASVSIVGGRIYTMGRREGTEFVMALKVEDGSNLWSTPLGPGRNQRGSNCTPTVDGDFVYAISIEGDLICVRADTGEKVWSKNFARDFGGRMMSGWGFSESPLIDGDLLVCTPGGDQALLAALDKRTGQEIWKSAVPNGGGAGYSSIVISRAGGIKQYVQLVGRGLVGVAADSGQLLWRYERIANGTANIPTPLIDGDFVFTSTGYGTGAALLRLSREGRGIRVQEEYFLNANKFQNHHGGMILLDGYVYCGHGHNNGFPICVEMKSGRIMWGGDQRGPGRDSAAVLYADGHLYFRYQDGTMALIGANPRAYQVKGAFRLATRHAESWPHPVIADGKLYLRDQQTLMCYDVKAR
jgi:outer membrane protein assembly factor BamB